MKKIILILISLCLIVSCSLQAQWNWNTINPFGDWYATVLEDDFTLGISGWNPTNSKVVHYDSDWNSIGRINVLLDSATATANALVYINFTTSATYRLTYDYYIPSANTTTDGIQAFSGVFLTNRTGVNSWITVSEEFAGTGYTTIRFYQTDGGARTTITIGDLVYIDNFKLELITSYQNYNPIKNNYLYNPE